MLTSFNFGEQTQNISGEELIFRRILNCPSLPICTHCRLFPLHTDEPIHRHHFLMDSQSWILIWGSGWVSIFSISHSPPHTHTCSAHCHPYPLWSCSMPRRLTNTDFISVDPLLSGLELDLASGNSWPRLKKERRKRPEYLFPDSQLWAALSKCFLLKKNSINFSLSPLSSAWGKTEWLLLTIGQGLSMLTILAFWALYFYVVRSCPAPL